jgi:hypothetical protein
MGMSRRGGMLWVAGLALVICLPPWLRADGTDDELAVIARVGPQGSGAAAARAAGDRLAQRGGEIVPRLLVAMEIDNSLAANWYRTAFEAIVERELARPTLALPIDQIKSFVQDPSRVGRVRRLALGLCDQIEAHFSERWIPRQLDDPEFRADAVEAALEAGSRALADGDSETARDAFQRAFEHARSSDQCVRAGDKLAVLGERVDTQAHLGLVVDWWVVGPFAAPGFSGFDQAFEPENRVDLAARYAGDDDRQLSWVRYRTADPLGLVNLVDALGPAKEAVAYLYTELVSPRERTAELRSGADDNCTIWLNGQKVFGRQQWLNGIRLDRFVTRVELRGGTNRLLVKVCQGPQHKDPQVANNWSLQLRFCDATGTAVPLRSALPPIAGGSH